MLDINTVLREWDSSTDPSSQYSSSSSEEEEEEDEEEATNGPPYHPAVAGGVSWANHSLSQRPMR